MSTRFYVGVGVAVFAGNVLYSQLLDTDSQRITTVENAVVHIAEDVQEIKAVVLEQKMDYVRYTAKEFDCLARNIYYEAGIENRVGKLSVAQVTLNRVKTGYWGKNICSVVYAPKQFSWTNIKKRAWIQNKGKNWQESVDVASQVLNYGVRVKTLNNSLYYHADYVKPNWQDHSKRITKVGRHIFYTQAKGTNIKL